MNVLERKSRLTKLESFIIRNLEGFVIVGNALKEIRDNELYREAGHETWIDYLRFRVGDEFGIEGRYAYSCITGSEVRPKLPKLILCDRAKSDAGLGGQWPLTVVLEFAKMAPKDESKKGNPRDFRKLRKVDVSKVAKQLIRHANENDEKLTAKAVRASVTEWCEDNGMSTKKKKKREAPSLDLNQYLIHVAETVEDAFERLEVVSGEMWEALEESDSGLAARAATGCDALAKFLRSP